MLTAGMSTRAVARECNVNFSTIIRLQRHSREFDTYVQPASQLQTTCMALHVRANGFANVNIVNRVPHGGGGFMLWAGISYGQRTQLHFIDVNLNGQRSCDEIPRPILVPSTHVST